jgi:ABC-type lipopolysaccharide export system ATPase subunit
VVLCEQNVTFAMEHADRVYLLENGRFERDGEPETFRGDECIRDAYLGGESVAVSTVRWRTHHASTVRMPRM